MTNRLEAVMEQLKQLNKQELEVLLQWASDELLKEREFGRIYLRLAGKPLPLFSKLHWDFGLGIVKSEPINLHYEYVYRENKPHLVFIWGRFKLREGEVMLERDGEWKSIYVCIAHTLVCVGHEIDDWVLRYLKGEISAMELVAKGEVDIAKIGGAV